MSEQVPTSSPIAYPAIRIALIYVFLSGLWIAFSGRALAALVAQPALLAPLQAFKDWAFVALMAALLYLERWWAYKRDAALHEHIDRNLREAETRYRTLVEQIPAVVYIDSTDELSSAIYMSPQSEPMLGYRPEEWVADRELWVKLLHPDDRERAIAENNRTNQTGDPFCMEYRLLARDGRVVWVRDVAVMVRDRADRPLFWHGVMLDITERLSAEQAGKQAEEELRIQEQLFESLVAVARATAERPTLDATLKNALDVTATLTNAEHGDLFLLDDAGRVALSSIAYGEMSDEQRQQIVSDVMDKGLAGWVAHHHQPVLIEDTLRDDRWLKVIDLPAIRSVVSVPILTGTTLLGVLTLFHSEPGHFNAEHLRLLQAAADQMSLAVRNAQIFDAQRRMTDQKTTLYKVLSAMSKQVDPDAVAWAAVAATVKFAGWPNVAIAAPDRSEARWTIHATSGPLSPALGIACPIDQGVIGRAFVTGQPQLVPDVGADPSYVAHHPDIRSELVVPLRRGDQVLGVLNLESNRLAAFQADDVSLAESLADAIALALENGRLFQATRNERSRLDALIKSSRDGIVLVSIDRRILVINEPALQMLRLPGEPEEWVNCSVWQPLNLLRRYAPAMFRGVLGEMRRIKRGDEPPGEGEHPVPPRVIHWLNLPVLTDTTPVGRLLALRDVTNERAAEQLREDMTRTMVHDLRSPLGSIYTAVEFLKTDAADRLLPMHSQSLEIASRSAQKLLKLINSILDMSRLESGRLPLNRAQVRLEDVVAEVLKIQLPLATAKALRLENLVPVGLPSVWADAELIGRVLQNLVSNAIKFTPEGGAVRVAATAQEHEGRPMLFVTVDDNGSGIPPEIQGHLFQKFVTGRQVGRGSGLGLAFCKLVIEAHGERIWVDSAPERGTTFTFTLATCPTETK